MKLQGKKIALFLANMFEDLEFWYPWLRMQEEGAEVTAIGPEAEVYHGKNGLSAEAALAARDAHPEDFHALIIPGGYSPDYMRRSREMVDFVKQMNDSGKMTAAICHGPWMLASADIVRGKRVTSFFSIKDDVVNAGGIWVDEEAVQDGNIITSRKVSDLPAFCLTLINSLGAGTAEQPEESHREAWAGRL
ncbi:MAG: type 1 glutamine amidotransferase domain-containing protein [Candidatus Latescibacterota bacterium]